MTVSISIIGGVSVRRIGSVIAVNNAACFAEIAITGDKYSATAITRTSSGVAADSSSRHGKVSYLGKHSAAGVDVGISAYSTVP